MKSLLKNVRILNFEDLLSINGGYSGSSGGGSSTSSHSFSCSSSHSSSGSGYSGSSGGGSSRSTTRTSSSRSSSYSASSAGSGKSKAAAFISTYSASSQGTAGQSGKNFLLSTGYCVSSAGNWNSPRVTLLSDGTAYSSLTGFTGPAASTIGNGSNQGIANISGGDNSLNATDQGKKSVLDNDGLTTDVSRMNQRDFNYISETFGENACCATSLLNELSEIASAEGGTLSTNKMKSAMDAAIRSGAILTDETIKYTDKGTKYTDCGYVANYVKAANAMAKEMGLSGEFYESSYNSSGRSTLIFAVDKNNDSKHIPDHFYASLNDHTYYDPWTGKTGDVSEFSRNGWTVTTRCLGYRKN